MRSSDPLQLLSADLMPLLWKASEERDLRLRPAWSEADLRLIAANMTSASPKSWKLTESMNRIVLLHFRPFPQGQFAEKLALKLEEFEELISCKPPFKPRAATLDELLPMMMNMMSLAKWTMNNVQPAVGALKQVTSIHWTGSSLEDRKLAEDFQSRWSAFLEDLPALMGQVDPWYVHMLGVPPGAGWAAPLHSAHSDFDQGQAVANTNNQVWSFVTKDGAAFFSGQLTTLGIDNALIQSTHALLFP